MNEVTIVFNINDKKSVSLFCVVADSFYKKTKGLMNRKSLPEDYGMFFPFLFSWFRLFWMKNVKIPLDIIFINSNLRVCKICEKSAESNIFHKDYWASGFAKYIIECNKGFCKNNKISIGTKISISKN